jgi:hypothetical protein
MAGYMSFAISASCRPSRRLDRFNEEEGNVLARLVERRAAVVGRAVDHVDDAVGAGVDGVDGVADLVSRRRGSMSLRSVPSARKRR